MFKHAMSCARLPGKHLLLASELQSSCTNTLHRLHCAQVLQKGWLSACCNRQQAQVVQQAVSLLPSGLEAFGAGLPCVWRYVFNVDVARHLHMQ